MTIAKCPKCNEQVTVPQGASREAQVRCPMCSEQYSLAAALDSLPPLLVVVHDPGAGNTSADAEFDEAPSFAGVAQVAGPAADVDQSIDDFMFEPSPAPSQPAPAFQFESKPVPSPRPSTAATSSRSRSRRKQGSPVRLIVQTIGGGVLGLIIAQFILWWMPGNWDVSNRDPFGLASKVSPYAPFLLPASLRGGTPTAQADAVPEPSPFSDFGGNQPANANKKAAATPSDSAGSSVKPDAPTDEKLDSTIPDFQYNAKTSEPPDQPGPDGGIFGGPLNPESGGQEKEGSADKKKGTDKKGADKKGADKKGADKKGADKKGADKKGKQAASEPMTATTNAEPTPAPSTEPAAAPVTPDPFDLPDLSLDPDAKKKEASAKKEKAGTTKSAPESPPATEPTETPPPASTVQLQNAPDVKPADIPDRLQQLAAANQDWDTAENPSREQMRDMIVAIHDQLSRVGDAAAVSALNEPLDQEVQKPAEEALQTLATQPAKLSPLGALAAIRLPDVANQGMAIYGSVLSHQRRGELFETQVKLHARTEATVSVLSTRDLSEQLPAGANALIAGRLIADPAKNLTGYEGDAPKALLHGVHAVVQ